MGKLKDWAYARAQKIMASRKADFMVGTEEDPYLRRWRTTPSWLSGIGAVYLHEFCRDDDDVPHDHPYLFCVSWVLQIGYYENQFHGDAMAFLGREGVDYRDHMAEPRWLAPGAVLARWGWTPHRVTLKRFKIYNGLTKQESEFVGHPISLFFCGPRVREWGFWCPAGWRPWREYIAPTSYGNRKGVGCD